MYEPFRTSLMAIWSEMSRASRKYPALYHQRLSDPILVGPDVISVEAFAAFPNKFPSDEWASWERTPDGSYWGRFHGSGEGLDVFERLAESAYLVLQEFDSQLPEGHGFHGWLNVIHDMARDFPTPLLRTRHGVWDVDPQPTGDKFDEIVARWETSGESGVRFRPHPFSNLLVHNVFTSSMSAIELVLDPDKALLVGDWLNDFSVTLRGTQNDPEPDQNVLPRLPRVESAVQQPPPFKIEPPVQPTEVARPIIEITFDAVTWVFRYKFVGNDEVGTFSTDLFGFKLYKALLARDGQKPLSSLALLREAGLHHPVVSSTSSGTVDGDSDDRHAELNAEDNETVRLESPSRDKTMDAEGLNAIDKQLKALNDDLQKCANPERREEIRQEITSIEVWRSKSVNRRGKSRTLVGSEEEKARKRVTNRLKDARNTMTPSMSVFVHYLLMTVKNKDGWSYDSRRASALLATAKRP